MDNQYHSLLVNLLTKTRARQVYWLPTSDSNQFIVTSGAVSVSLYSGFDEEQDNNYITLSIRNDKGVSIDSYHVSPGEEDWEIIDELFALQEGTPIMSTRP